MRDNPALLEVKLRRWQQISHECLSTQNILLAHRRSGKSWYMGFAAAYMLYLSPLPVPISVFSSSMKKARDLLFQHVQDLLESRATSYITFNKSELKIRNNRTGSQIQFYALSEEHKNQARGSIAALCIVDEAGECSQSGFLEVVLPSMRNLPDNIAHLRTLIVSGTLLGSHDLLYSLIAKYESLSPDFSDIDIDQTTPDKPIHIPDDLTSQLPLTSYRLFDVPLSRTKMITPDEQAEDRLMMGDAAFEREFENSRTATADDVLFTIDAIHRAATLQPHDPPNLNLTPTPEGHINDPDRSHDSYSAPVAGLDIGRSQDSTILTIYQSLSRPLFCGAIKTHNNDVLNKTNMEQQVSQIERILRRYNCERLCLDEAGLGAFFLDRCIERLPPFGINVQGIHGNQRAPYHYQNEAVNMRAALYKLLAAAMNAGMKIPHLRNLFEELSATTTKPMPQDSRTALITKPDLKAKINRSPDISDSLSYVMFWFAELTQEDFLITLRHLKEGKVIMTNSEILSRYPELYGNTEGAEDPVWSDSMINEVNYDSYEN